jgi:hypothetical protein
LAPFESGIWYLNIAVTIALLIRLWVSHLAPIYRWLFIYLAVGVLQQCALLFTPRTTNLYGWTYIAGQSIKIVLVVFVVLELYRLALAGQPALAKYGQNTVAVVLFASAGIAALGLLIDPTAPPGRSMILYRFFSFERTMDSFVLVFLVLITLFMTWFPVRMKRNVALYVGGFILLFLSRSAYMLLLNVMSVRHLGTLNSGMQVISSTCLLVWLFTLGKEGEKTTTVVGHRWDPAAMDRMSGQLDAINASLMKLSRSERGV